MDLERLKLTKTVKGKKGRDKVRPDTESVPRECERTLFSALRAQRGSRPDVSVNPIGAILNFRQLNCENPTRRD